MPLDVPGCTRATMIIAVSIFKNSNRLPIRPEKRPGLAYFLGGGRFFFISKGLLGGRLAFFESEQVINSK